MGSYPETFSGKIAELPKRVDQSELNKHGFYVMSGLTIDLALQLIERSAEPHVVKNCENDAKKRFTSLKSIEDWQAKNRLPIPLVRHVGRNALRRLEGFGWMGPQEPGDEEPPIPGAKVTFAMRIYSSAMGNGYATPYTKAILDAHKAIIGNNQGVWLEAYGDNFQAIKPYQRAGFEEVGRYQGICHGEPRERVQMTLGKLSV